MSGWIGVDLDGTLAKYEGWNDGKIGEPIPLMVNRVKQWLADGREVRIFTARVGATNMFCNGSHRTDDNAFAMEQSALIQDWCEQHIGVRLRVTATKDFSMIELWDDRAVQVICNTGQTVSSL